MDEKLDVSNLDENCLSLEEDCCLVNMEGEFGYFFVISLQQSVKDGYNFLLKEWFYLDLSLFYLSVIGDDFYFCLFYLSFMLCEIWDILVSFGIS